MLSWLTHLVHEHRARLARVARREGLRPEDAFDAVQDAFQAYLTLPEAERLVGDLEGSRKLLTAIVRNVARNRRRLHALARPHDALVAAAALPASGPTAEDLLLAAEEQLRFAGCLGKLVEVQRVVVSLRMLDGLAGDEVAKILGLTPGHVAVLLSRARGKLASCMAPCDSGAGRTHEPRVRFDRDQL
jgi:RNA polymerase sigma-70 factor (ECF subfamily)